MKHICRSWMLKSVFLTISLLLLSGAAAFTQDRVAQWRQDLNVLVSGIEARHPNPFTHISHADFDKAVNELDQAIPTLSNSEIIVSFMRLVALIGDAHTSLLLMRVPQFRQFPVRLYWFGDGLYVTKTTTESALALGTRLIRIGDMSIAEALPMINALISHENEYWVRQISPQYFSCIEVLQALEIPPIAGSGLFRFERTNGEQFTLELLPLTPGESSAFLYGLDPVTPETPLYRQHPNQYYWYAYLDSKKLLYLQYNQCAEQAGRPIDAFAQELSGFVATHPVEYFILDLRNNTGGNSALIERLLGGIQPFILNLSRGHFFCIIGRATVSSGMLNAILISQNTEAIFLGEPTGGKPNHFGDIKLFTLPDSALQISCSSKYFQTMEEDPLAFFPDVNLPPTTQAFFGNQDPVLEWVLNAPPIHARFDLDGDGQTTFTDVQILANYLASNSMGFSAGVVSTDFMRDGRTDAVDLVKLISTSQL